MASKALVDKHGFSLSPATIRNEMGDLEQGGYIYQPHTSAGRIPTEKGWKLYIENFIKDIELSKEQKKVLDIELRQHGLSYEQAIKNAAKHLAEISKDAVFVGFGDNDFYYTGLSNLFRQPEFRNIDLVYHMSEVIDHLDEVMNSIMHELNTDTKIFVGSENPFGKECGSIIGRYSFGKNHTGVFGILGPMRMNYENNLALIKYAAQLFLES